MVLLVVTLIILMIIIALLMAVIGYYAGTQANNTSLSAKDLASLIAVIQQYSHKDNDEKVD